jgi:magnesium-transporting ATPase (P-type)
VLQVLALDIGTDLLPALALGVEPANPRTMRGPMRLGSLLDARVVRRAFGVLGPAEALTSMIGFLVVLTRGGWSFGETADPDVLALASGTAFAAIVLGQLANAFACRSESRWVGAVGFRGNPTLLMAVAVEVVMLLAFVGLPPLARLLGGSVPDATGWMLALLAIPAVWAADASAKAVAGRRTRRSALSDRPPGAAVS